MSNETTEPETAADQAGRDMSDLLAAIPPSIDEVVNKAAEHLPRGYVINIMVEHEGWAVTLEKPNGTVIDNIDGGDGLISDVNEALCIANGFSS